MNREKVTIKKDNADMYGIFNIETKEFYGHLGIFDNVRNAKLSVRNNIVRSPEKYAVCKINEIVFEREADKYDSVSKKWKKVDMFKLVSDVTNEDL